MRPYVFKKNDSRSASDTISSTKMTLRFTGRHIFPSLLLARFLDIQEGSYVTFMLDEDEPTHVYIKKANAGEPYTAKVCLRDKKTSAYRMSALAVVRHILDVTDANSTVTLFVSPKPVLANGVRYYRILTDKPYSIK